jgi:hypothetical protein
MNGAATGTGGSKVKKKNQSNLFPKNMRNR